MTSPNSSRLRARLSRAIDGTSPVAHLAEELERRVMLDGAPQLVQAWFDYLHAPHTISFQFNQDVSASLEATTAPLALDNLTTGEEFSDSTDNDPDWNSNANFTQEMTWNSTTDTATFSFPDYIGGVGTPGVLDDGWYQATLSPQNVTNAAGTPLAAPATLQFEYINGDIASDTPNSSGSTSFPDGRVDAADEAALMAGWNTYAGKTGLNPGYLDGDLDYSGTIDSIDIDDFYQDWGVGPFAPPPSAPGQLVLNTVSTSEIDLAWPQVPNGTLSDGTTYTVTGYRIERSDDGENFYELADVNPANLNTANEGYTNGTFYYHDTGLGDGQREWYRIRALVKDSGKAIDASPYSAYTDKQWAVTPLLPPTNDPAQPISPYDVHVSFESNSTNVMEFDVQRSSDLGQSWGHLGYVTPGQNSEPQLSSSGSTFTFDDDTAAPGAFYWYRAVAINNWTDSAGIAASTFTPLVTPTGLTATTPSPNEIDLNWSETDTTNITGYYINRSDASGHVVAFNIPASQTYFDDTTVSDGAAYTYAVTATCMVQPIDALDRSAASTPVTATTPWVPFVVAISGATGVQQGANYTLNMSVPTPGAGTITGWDIYWGDSPDDTPDHINGNPSSATHSYDNYDTDNTITAYADVTFPDGSNGAIASNTVDVTTTPAPPSAPSDPVATVEYASDWPSADVQLTWALAADSYATSLVVQVESSIGPGGFYNVATLTGDATRFDDSSIFDPATYTFRIQANNAAGPPAFSTFSPVTVSATPPTSSKPGPTNLQVTLTPNETGAVLTWTPSSDPTVAGYVIYRDWGGYFALTDRAQVGNVGPSVGTLTDSGLIPFVGYQYSVYAYDAQGHLLNAQFASVEPTIGSAAAGFTVGYDDNVIALDDADPDFSGVPDFANDNIAFWATAGAYLADSNLAPVMLDIPTSSNDQEDTLKFNYTTPTLPESPSALPDDYYNFSNSQSSGVLRIWHWNPITQTLQFVRPGETFSWNPSGANYSLPEDFYVQGINVGVDTISVTETSQYLGTFIATQSVTVADTELLLNTTNSGPIASEPQPSSAGGALNIDDPDPNFNIGPNDILVKDQGTGFNFWYGSDDAGSLSAGDLSSLFPVQLTIPSQFRQPGWTYGVAFLASPGSTTAPGVNFYLPASTSNPIAYVQSAADEAAQLQEPLYSNNIYSGPLGATAAPTMGAPPFLLAHAGAGQTTVSGELELTIEDPGGSVVAIATSKLTLHPIDELWSLWSARTPATATISVPTEDGRSAQLTPYQAPVFVPPSGSDPGATPLPGVFTTDNATPDPNHQILVFVHGFNTTQTEAVTDGNTLYQNLYWAGYRGDLVEYDWLGDTGKLNFGQAVQNAFDTAPTFANFLTSDVDTWAGGNPKNVNILAHSLGNLVAWEALRDEAAWDTEEDGLVDPIANNILSVESAIPQEAFQPLQSITYQFNPPAGALYSAQQQGDVKTYSVSDLQMMSWLGWFTSTYNPLDSLTGYAFNSYSPNDSILAGAFNAYQLSLGGGVSAAAQATLEGQPPDLESPVFYSPSENNGFRTIGTQGQNDLWNIPSLLSTRYQKQVGTNLFEKAIFGNGAQFVYPTQLTLAAGQVPNPLVDSTNEAQNDPYTDVQATQLGWQGTDHSFLFDAPTIAAANEWYTGYIGDALGFHSGQANLSS